MGDGGHGGRHTGGLPVRGKSFNSFRGVIQPLATDAKLKLIGTQPLKGAVAPTHPLIVCCYAVRYCEILLPDKISHIIR